MIDTFYIFFELYLIVYSYYKYIIFYNFYFMLYIKSIFNYYAILLIL